MELTDEERKILALEDRFLYEDDTNEAIVSTVGERLIDLYFVGVNDYPSLKSCYEATGRLLKSLYNARTWETPSEETFSAKDVFPESLRDDEILKYFFESLPETIIEKFDPNLFDSPEELMKYIQASSKELNVSQMKSFKEFVVQINDCFRQFMTGYIPRIVNNMYAFDRELDMLLSSDVVMENPDRNL